MADCETFFLKTCLFQNIFYTHVFASAEHPDHIDVRGKISSLEETVVKPNSREGTQPNWKTGHICGSGKSTEKNAIFMFKLKIR